MISTPLAVIERRLADQLRRDRAHPSRCTAAEDGTIVVRVSGTSAGLAYAISLATGEDDEEIYARVAADVSVSPPA